MSENETNQVFEEFLQKVREDPFALQALADCIADGTFPKYRDPNGVEKVQFTSEGLEIMEARENELRREAN